MKQVYFEIEAKSDSEVFLAGEFNNWDPKANKTELNPQKRTFSTSIELAPGAYGYKFIVNGVWRIDSDNTNWEMNGKGTLNSIITVEEQDHE